MQAAVWSILMFIDRKINGALIQDLAQKGWGCKCEGWWKSNRQGRKNWRGRKGLVRWGRKRSDDETSRWPLPGMSSPTCEQPVVASFLFLSLRTALECTWTNLKWNLRKAKKRVGRAERRGREGEKNQFSQTEAGWSNGGLKEEEERTYFPLITSYRLSGKPWKLAWLQPAALLVRPFPGRYGAALLPTPAAIELWAGEDEKHSKWQSKWPKVHLNIFAVYLQWWIWAKAHFFSLFQSLSLYLLNLCNPNISEREYELD